ncbi:MAG: multicopper oxidase domain-containing protein [Deltaproteobacteria bacterium]|nr:multicopper oxidase domain-containing protein [Deltaproteobacteria bacterium]
MKRRDFIKYSARGLTAVALGGTLRWPELSRSPAYAQAAGLTVNLSMEEALVEMVDGNLVFHWLFQLQGAFQPSVPGPVIFAFTGDNVTINVTNNLDEVHEFRIIAAGPGLTDLNTGPINPGETATLTFVAPNGGTYMYLDPRNAPVNRVLGLHGAFIVLPDLARNADPGPDLLFDPPVPTPYTNPTAQVQQLFNDLGRQPFFQVRPGENGQSWVPVRPEGVPLPEPFQEVFEEGILTPDELARLEALERFLFRTRIWVSNGIDPRFNAIAEAGGNAEPGGGIDPAAFQAEFLARYFHLNGKTGAFASIEHIAPESVLAAFIGQPHVVRILNAGVNDFSFHLHANHFYVLAVNNVVLESVPQPDSMTIQSLERELPLAQVLADPLGPTNRLFLNSGSRVDWLVPYTRPPDIPGDPGTPLQDLIPEELAIVLGGVPQSPLMYPMHSHVELDQTAAGGNYPQGLISHIVFLGELVNGEEVHFPATEVPLRNDGTPKLVDIVPQPRRRRTRTRAGMPMGLEKKDLGQDMDM